VSSTIAISDGQTIGLAGLIQEKNDSTNTGLPWLQEVPVVGLLFGTRDRQFTHSEILVLITPRVIRGRDEGDAVTRELREKLRLTIPVVHRR
jgi:general secretion pathway protein D